MKMTSSAVVFLLSGFLSSFCWAIPTSAVVSPDTYRQQIDKLDYPAEDYLRSTGPLDASKPTTRPKDELVQGELVQPAPIQEVLKPDVVTQRSRRIPITPKKAPRLDPYSLIAAKRRHSHSIGHSIASRERATSSITTQLSERNQVDAWLLLTIRRQPKRFLTMLGNEKDELQRLSSQQFERRQNDFQVVIEDIVKEPLRHMFKKIESLSHKAAKQLN
ncbi:hypothetical protein S7335_5050 [Synechococcus sp. PCC 7335]|uniref:hypothetical protein n=1 Tax=Synechococcus sp. (strain ATCC 29403 / PCC 7335) TaxID=91464 RepID=UPI00017EBC0D|nr:hypothetical protein [Synechococcus sp. PCC 7335]EDX87341.1 hypothetical protein S7335_5050 [Synechococcus sp. PCC 7335]